MPSNLEIWARRALCKTLADYLIEVQEQQYYAGYLDPYRYSS